MARSSRLAFRVEASSSVGYGHFVRCSALIDALEREASVECAFVTRSSLQTARPLIRLPNDVPVAAEDAFLGALSPAPDAIIADLKAPTQEHVDALRRGSRKLVWITDEPLLRTDFDLVVRPSFEGDGGNYVLLRQQFAGLGQHVIAPVATRLLICFGGSDPVDMSGKLVSLLPAVLPRSFSQVTVVVGPGYGGIVQEVGGRVHVESRVTDMASRFREADVGLLAAGTLLYEAAACGLPTLLVSLAPDQAREARIMEERGAALYLGPHDSIHGDRLSAALTRIADPNVRERLSTRAQALIDGRGSTRVARRVLALFD